MARFDRFEHRQTRALDGTALRYQVMGAGPAIVFSNGLGGFSSFWRYQLRLLARHYSVICWDYRGLFPTFDGDRRAPLDMATQARDLETILDAEGVERALLVGWSMGVQVSLEFARERLSRVVGFVAINGTAGRPFETAFGATRWRRLIRPSLRLMSSAAPVMRWLLPRLAHWGAAEPMLHWLGASSSRIDDGRVFIDLARDWSRIDYGTYAKTFFRLGEHDAWDVLPRFAAPTLIIAGDADVMTPLDVALRMADELPDARLCVLPGGSHFSAVQHCETVNRQLAEFIAEIGYGDFVDETLRERALLAASRALAALPAARERVGDERDDGQADPHATTEPSPA